MKLTISKDLARAALLKLQAELQAEETKNRAEAIEAIGRRRQDDVDTLVRRIEENRRGLKEARAALKKPISDELIRRYMPHDYTAPYNRRTGEYGPTKYEQTEIELRRLALVTGDSISINVESALGKLLGL